MAMSRGRPAFATDDWMLEQQLRAEVEAEGWRSLRQKLATPQALAPPESVAVTSIPTEIDHHRAGSTILKALVRFLLASFAAYLAYLAGADAHIGEVEIWLAVGSSFVVALALSMFGGAREFVHLAAETMRWVLLIGIGLGATYLAFNWPG
jgi:hypothetical protein